MNPKMIVLVLVGLGLVAAVSAAVLVASLRIQPVAEVINAAPEDPDMTILVASGNTTSAHLLESDSIMERTLPTSEAPLGAYTDVTQVLGRVVIVPMVKGQVFTNACFAPDGSGAQLAALLPNKMRAVSISLSDFAGLEGILYPGSFVDILASFRTPSGTSMGEAVSTTLLQNLEVLAVDQVTVGYGGGAQGDQTDPNNRASTASKGQLVTVKVDSRQAEALQLASIYGAVSLALRNPLDGAHVDSVATLLSGGQLARLAEEMVPSVNDEGVVDIAPVIEDPDSAIKTIEATAPESNRKRTLDVQQYRGSAYNVLSWEIN
jgi:pilus assembly protein CpaB